MMLLTNYEGRAGVEPCRTVLEAGGSALDAVEQGVRAVEADTSVKSVGRGGYPKLSGEVECDAAIMNGTTLEAGAVGALRDYLHAVSVARAVMEKLPHVMLVGAGAERFAAEVGAERAEMLTGEMRARQAEWVEKYVPAEERGRWPDVPLARHAWTAGNELEAGGTVVLLAKDAKGDVAAATSTSGWARGYPGRLGDSPIIGAGLYADTRLGAAGCTHIGEMTIRAGTSRSVVLYIKQGMSVDEACREAMADLGALRGGFLGNVVVHAIDFYGNPCVVANKDLGEKSAWFYWSEATAEPELRAAEVVPFAGHGQE